MKTFNTNLQGHCGVYIIFNLVNGKRYIGSAKDLYARLCTHLSLLRHQKEHNDHLQNAWNKYGEEAFDYGILEYCELEERFNKEQYYITLLKPEYNITENVIANFGHAVTTECKRKISETLKRRYAAGEIVTYKQQHSWISCYLYDAINFKFIAKFNNLADCTRFLNYKHGSDIKLFNTFIFGKYIIVKEKFSCISELKNYVFKNFRKMNLSPIHGQRYLVTEVDSKITYHDSITNCCKLGFSKSSIYKHLDATKEYPYIHPKFPNIKIYFTKEYIELPYDAAKISEEIFETSTKNGENCDVNTVVTEETKESSAPYSVEAETVITE